MEFDFEAQYHLIRKHMTANMFFRLPINSSESEFDNDIQAFVDTNTRNIAGEKHRNKEGVLKILHFISAQQKDAHCGRLADETNARSSSFLFKKFGIFSI